MSSVVLLSSAWRPLPMPVQLCPAVAASLEALWWTAMLMTTLGGEHIPQTVEGRILNFILALYAFVSFGYITATLATFFVESDAKKREEKKAEIKPTLKDLEKELTDMRAEIRELLAGRNI